MSRGVTKAVHNRRSLHPDHRRHDRVLIARFAGGDSYPTEEREARALVAGCTECAALAADIRLLARATGALPAARRPRDFRLTSEQAERVRGSALARLLRALGGPGWGTLRPVAGVAMSIGLALAVIGGGLPMVLPAAGGPSDLNTFGTQAPALAPGPTRGAPEPATGAPLANPPEINAPDEQPGVLAEETSAPVNDSINRAYLDPSPAPDSAPGKQAAVQQPAETMREALIYGGLIVAAAGLALLLLVWLARRRFADPLLR